MTLNPEEFTNLHSNESLLEDDEDLCWEPLEASTTLTASANIDTLPAAPVSLFLTGSSTNSGEDNVSSSNRPNAEPSQSNSSSADVPNTSAEAANILKQKLVDHPIQLFWSHFFMHLLQQLWQLDVRIRVGFTLILTGIVFKIVVVCLSFSWYHPKTIVLTSLLTASFVYVDPLDWTKSWNDLGRTWALSSPEAALVEWLERLDPVQLRYGCLSLLVIPTILEARTVAYLALVQTQATSWPLYNLAIFSMIAGLFTFLLQNKHTSPRDAWQKGVLVLYGSAILITVIRLDLTRLPQFAAPFCLATGTLLVTYRDNDMEWLSRTVRHALRLTLRDVLSAVSANVQQDEMLRIIMLRWIVDYWTGSAAAAQPETSSSATPATLDTTDLVMVPRSQGGGNQPHELQWDELWSMLNLTMDQVQMEVPRPPYQPTSSSASSSSSTTQPPPPNDSVNNIKIMLASMDLDQHAKPAVVAYKRAVEAFPPTRQVAIFISIVRRCPAFLAWLWFYSAAARFPWALTLLLSPFVALDFLRLQEWMTSCQQTASELVVTASEGNGNTSDENSSGKSTTNALGELEPMTILLSGDHFVVNRPPTLLVVWTNVVSSVSALEMGLTAARCIQTTAVAAAFAQNILSLAEFGAQVSEHGWFHGWTILLQELFQSANHENDGSGTSNNNRPKYTSAAVNAIRHGNIVARNLRVMAEEGERNLTFGHLWQFVTMVLGQGWSGPNGTGDPRTASTVEITEINEDIDEAPTTASQRAENDDTVAGRGVENEVAEPHTGELLSVQSLTQVSENESEVRQKQPEDLSPVMDLIAVCFERGLIDEDEKNEFVSSLVGSAGEDKEVREGFIQKLQTILQGVLNKSLGSTTPPDNTGLLFGRDTPDSLLGRSTPDSTLGRSSPDSTRERDADRGLADSFVSSLLSRSQSFDEINSIPSLETGERRREFDQPPLASAETQEIEGSASPETQSQGEGTSQQGGDDWLKWVGGGLAIVGAVVGGVAIANAVQGGGAQTQTGEQRRENSSSVQIELLDDDEGHSVDEWVSVSRS